MGASWKLFGLPWDLISNIMNKKAYRKPKKASRKPPGSYKEFHGRNPEIISLLFWDKLIFHKDIIKLSDLYQLQNYQNVTEITSNMIYIVAFGVGLKCPRKTQKHDYVIYIELVSFRITKEDVLKAFIA